MKHTLYCEICTQFGERLHPHAEVATFDTREISLPLESDMFSAALADRGAILYWGESWQTFQCPWHRGSPFVLNDADALRAIKEGGPGRLLTEIGWYTIHRENGPVHSERMELTEEGDEEKKADLPDGKLQSEEEKLSDQETDQEIKEILKGTDIVDTFVEMMDRGTKASEIGERFGLTRQRVGILVAKRKRNELPRPFTLVERG